jgi:3-oxoacyl-[acyl-carrier protein] reductase
MNSGGVVTNGDTGIRNGYRVKITGFWGFIHSLFVENMAGLKRMVITGGSGGLGKAIALEFAGKGWEVIALSRSDLDLLDGKAVAGFFETNPCDLLICCAGIIRDVPLSRMEEEQWDDVFAVNFKAAALSAAAVVPGMLAKGRGHVIFVSSYAALHPAVGQAAYATAKAALHGLARDLADRHGRAGLRFNVVLPGFLETRMTEAVSMRRKEVVRETHCLGRFNSVGAAAGFIRYLEEQLPFTSGQVFSLDSRM